MSRTIYLPISTTTLDGGWPQVSGIFALQRWFIATFNCRTLLKEPQRAALGSVNL